ncbi:hypothetical protein [Marinimicrobium sp. ABcell2]|uniref:hypothetical protein n=1 Tax=Marinimicrobium sp. ABcell2 TaxID=3069751 RepID=UPI0027B53D86|nr:hypothetical protein [Marinimicrobium sp. ABcell2]MDQ2077451.1 hypothetical protein [Marinimicrobium sp. ABcell2]
MNATTETRESIYKAVRNGKTDEARKLLSKVVQYQSCSSRNEAVLTRSEIELIERAVNQAGESSNDPYRGEAKLEKLKKRIGQQGALSERIEFLVTVYGCGLLGDLRFGELTNITERDFDTCVEMGDGGEVIHGLIKRALDDDDLLERIIEGEGLDVWKAWHAQYEEIERQITSPLF